MDKPMILRPPARRLPLEGGVIRFFRPLTLLVLLSAITVLGALTTVVALRPVAEEATGGRPAKSGVLGTEGELVRALLADAATERTTLASARAPAMWVRVRNSAPLWNANAKYMPNDPCFISEGTKVELMDIADGQLVVRYTPTHRPRGSNCPAGTLFRLPVPAQARTSN